ncbi:conserved hypothetical protein [Culex quinquefasciatus]|uniref:Uncharacterized protein n=1 Tax=Culex quinquefasciatus TaxID=7176 RepID=B0X7C6_CULQU|nr:conserved hypothetical protein [Culex quinquefasciatus]|eukprot:XP_001865548.1 conserved hypothetical protein [Culex quinquefasciatus]
MKKPGSVGARLAKAIRIEAGSYFYNLRDYRRSLPGVRDRSKSNPTLKQPSFVYLIHTLDPW